MFRLVVARDESVNRAGTDLSHQKPSQFIQFISALTPGTFGDALRHAEKLQVWLVSPCFY